MQAALVASAFSLAAVLGVPLVFLYRLGNRTLAWISVLLVLQIPSLWPVGRVLFETGYQPSQPFRHAGSWLFVSRGVGAVGFPLPGVAVTLDFVTGYSTFMVDSRDPLGDGWMLRVRVADMAQFDALLDQAAYDELVKNA